MERSTTIDGSDERPGVVERIESAWGRTTHTWRLAVLVAAAVGATAVSLAAVSSTVRVAMWVVIMCSGSAAVVDAVEHRLPNALHSISLAAVGIAVVLGPTPGSDVLGVAIGALLAAVPLAVFRYGHGLGLGDVKFAFVLGAAIGLARPALGLLIVWVAAVGVGLTGTLTGRRTWAIGPWLFGAFVTSCAALAAAPLALDRLERLVG
jgi:prepilin signal peptidase PulO-like enzyme (type II secretory pathway)